MLSIVREGSTSDLLVFSMLSNQRRMSQKLSSLLLPYAVVAVTSFRGESAVFVDADSSIA